VSNHTTSAPTSDRTDDSPAPTGELATEFAVQDWLLIIEALGTCAGPPPVDDAPPRANGALTRPRTRRAWELLAAIIAVIDLPPDEITSRIDDDWHGHGSGLVFDAPEGE